MKIYQNIHIAIFAEGIGTHRPKRIRLFDAVFSENLPDSREVMGEEGVHYISALFYKTHYFLP